MAFLFLRSKRMLRFLTRQFSAIFVNECLSDPGLFAGSQLNPHWPDWEMRLPWKMWVLGRAAAKVRVGEQFTAEEARTVSLVNTSGGLRVRVAGKMLEKVGSEEQLLRRMENRVTVRIFPPPATAALPLMLGTRPTGVFTAEVVVSLEASDLFELPHYRNYEREQLGDEADFKEYFERRTGLPVPGGGTWVPGRPTSQRTSRPVPFPRPLNLPIAVTSQKGVLMGVMRLDALAGGRARVWISIAGDGVTLGAGTPLYFISRGTDRKVIDLERFGRIEQLGAGGG